MAEGSLRGRQVAVYVGGSIAAFKACEVVTLLRKGGAEVRVAMTPGAAHFVTAMTLQSLSGNPVAADLWENEVRGAGHGMAHIAISQWADVQVAVPASASLLARLALGIADDAVTASALACAAPLVVVPAMESAMWEHPATREHVATLRARGARVVGPAVGRLASGRVGPGRMVEPDEVVAAVSEVLAGAVAGAPGGAGNVGSAPDGAGSERWLQREHVVVTAGGTREPLDPVRFIGNRSSGKMGNALALEALRLGAHVTLVSAAAAPPQTPGLDVVEVETAEEMLAAVRSALDAGARLLLMAAAVADYRPALMHHHKLKKREAEGMSVELVPTVDVLRALADGDRRPGLLTVGFAAETRDLVGEATRKLREKRLDLIVANDVSAPGVGMGADDNAVTIIGPGGVVAEVPRAPKAEVARAVFEAVRSAWTSRR